jgi:hypothetical protein
MRVQDHLDVCARLADRCQDNLWLRAGIHQQRLARLGTKNQVTIRFQRANRDTLNLRLSLPWILHARLVPLAILCLICKLRHLLYYRMATQQSD